MSVIAWYIKWGSTNYYKLIYLFFIWRFNESQNLIKEYPTGTWKKIYKIEIEEDGSKMETQKQNQMTHDMGN